MSSNINVGFVDGGRMCSRILKPPGGGYSEIFFEDSTTQISPPSTIATTTPKKTPIRAESTIESILRSDMVIETPKRKTPVKTPEIAKIIHEENGGKATKIVEETVTATIEKKVEQLKIAETKTIENHKIEEKNGDDESRRRVVEKSQEVVDSPGRRGRVPPGGFSTALW